VFAAVAKATAVTVTAVAVTAVAIAKTTTALLAIAIGFAHHRRGPLFVLLDAHSEIAQHVLIEPLLSFDLVDDGRRRVNIQEGEMCLAVLPQAIGERLDAPLFSFGDLAAHLLDHAFELGRYFFNLLSAEILARKHDVFIKRHCWCLSLSFSRPGAQPFEPGKARKLRRRKHRTTDQQSYRSAPAKRPSVQFPARNERRFAVIGSFDESARLDASCSARLLDRTDVAVPERNDDHEPGESMSVAFVFPGQGSQSVGMGKGLADAFSCARGVFEEIDAALGDKLSAVMWEGPADKVMLTENAQPALVAVSLAAMRVLQVEAGVDLKRDASFVAGHSVGEYSALAAAGSLSFADAVRLVRLRGRAMQEAVPVGIGAMAALLGVEFEQAAAIAAEAAQGEVVQAANDNGAGQVVVSGHKAAVERAIEIARTKGVRRTAMLPVSAPFHSALMKPAAAVMADALARVTVRPPAVPLVTNVLARATSDPGEIVKGLVEQVTGTVRWRESVGFMAQAGVSSFYEVGSGKVLSGLIQRIAKGALSFAIGAPDDIAAFKSKSMSH